MEKKGEVMKYHGNIYPHFLTKCLKQYDSKLAFEKIAITKNTQDSLPDSIKLMLEAKEITFERQGAGFAGTLSHAILSYWVTFLKSMFVVIFGACGLFIFQILFSLSDIRGTR